MNQDEANWLACKIYLTTQYVDVILSDVKTVIPLHSVDTFCKIVNVFNRISYMLHLQRDISPTNLSDGLISVVMFQIL